MRRQLLLLSVVIAVVMLVGCATGRTTYHHATVNSEHDGAMVSGYWPLALWRDRVMVIAVDGIQVDPSILPSASILVDPGIRNLTVWGNGFPGWEWEVKLKTTLVAGHAYKMRFERDEKLMTFWVEDVITHETVSEKQTADGNMNWGGNPFPLFPIR